MNTPTSPSASPESFTDYLLERGGAMTDLWGEIDGVIGVTWGAIECATREFADAAVRHEPWVVSRHKTFVNA